MTKKYLEPQMIRTEYLLTKDYLEFLRSYEICATRHNDCRDCDYSMKLFCISEFDRNLSNKNYSSIAPGYDTM